MIDWLIIVDIAAKRFRLLQSMSWSVVVPSVCHVRAIVFKRQLTSTRFLLHTTTNRFKFGQQNF